MPISPFIAHIDMDAFFAAIEERNNPRFAGLPIAVGADPKGGRGRGVVSTANYAARVYGIGSGQAISRAWKLSELAVQRGDVPVIFLPGSWRQYEESSDRIMEIIRQAAPIMQQRSVDEAYADLSFTGSLEAAAKIAAQIKERIYETERLVASVGVGPNKLVAKVASDFDKPDGFTVVDVSAAEDFLAPLSVRALPGVGPKTELALKKLGIIAIRDLQRRQEQELEELFGKWGTALYRKAYGLDDGIVGEVYDRKSIGQQRTFREDIYNPAVVIDKIIILSREVFADLRAQAYSGARTVAITVRFYDFTTTSCVHTFKQALVISRQIEQEAVRLLLPFLDARRNPYRKPIRLIGVRLEKLE